MVLRKTCFEKWPVLSRSGVFNKSIGKLLFFLTASTEILAYDQTNKNGVRRISYFKGVEIKRRGTPKSQ